MEISQIKVLIIGAHPDDAEVKAGGTAALFADLGHAVKFVSVTNGDAGHHIERQENLISRRRREADEAAQRLGIAIYQILNNHDAALLPTLEIRHQLIRIIRNWKADMVITHRPNDYHPDHRYTSTLVQDAAYLVAVPHVCPEVPALEKNPVFLYLEDSFQKPNPFQPDISVAIDQVISHKIRALDAHVSQFYEWLPWVQGRIEVPTDQAERLAFLEKHWVREISDAARQSLRKWYGLKKGNNIQYSESFEICEYGHQPSEEEIKKLFPMIYS